MERKYLYIIFSSTPYRIGKLIRGFTGETYNHASLSLDESLQPMYGFSRRFYRTPFYGGFVQESLSRYHANGAVSQFKVCKLPITQRQYEQFSHKLQAMYQRREHYLYNHLSVVSAPFGKLIPVKDAYICVEFCVHMLHQAGVDLDPRKYYSVGQLAQLLDPYTVYTGPAPIGEYDPDYYQAKPVPHPCLTSLRNIAALFPRLGIFNR